MSRNTLTPWQRQLVETLEYSTYAECDTCRKPRTVKSASYQDETVMWGVEMRMLWVTYSDCCTKDTQVPFVVEQITKIFLRKLLNR